MATQLPPSAAAPEVQVSSIEHLAHGHLRVTDVVEFGASLEAVLSGQTPAPPSGARFDAHVAGSVLGPRLRGSIAGIDHLTIRADGRLQLHIHLVITTEDGAKISFFADGVGTPDLATGGVQLHENIALHTSDARYQWVNTLAVWGRGKLDLRTQEVHVDAYVV